MKFYLVTVLVIVCVSFIPEKAYGLPSCTDAAPCPQFSSCSATGQPCQCNSGYHPNAASTACTPDIQPGSACTKGGNNAECVNNANCTSTTEGGQTTLKCKCNAGFHTMSSACAADIQPGASCTQSNVETECVANAICKNVNATVQDLKCTCKTGYHVMSGACNEDIQLGGACTSPGNDIECVTNTICMSVAGTAQCTCKTGFHKASGACVADIQPGSACTTVNSDAECVDNATCVAGTGGGQTCTCNSGFHVMSNACAADVGAGETCTMANTNTECVDHATCKSSQSANQTTTLCTCDDKYHQADNGTGKKICAADTCQHTVDKCKAAGTTTCPEIVTFMECLLTGVCQPSDADQLHVTRDVQVPQDCAVTNKITCVQKVSSCLIDHRKEEMKCTTIGTLGTCLTGNQASCSQGEDLKALNLANAYKDYMSGNYSCKCTQPIDTCLASASPTLENVNATATAKCNAVSDLFKCVIPNECNVSKTLDNRAVSGLWAKAMKGAMDNQCKDIITEAGATTCSLQLTRCSLIYGQEKHNPDTKLQGCRAAEAFGKCLKEKTGLCTEQDAARKKVFTDQYTLVSATCMCENDVNMCYDRAGVIPTDPAVACNKTRILGVCLMEAKCDMSKTDNPLYAAYQMYKNKTATYNCSTPTDKSCVSDVTVCAHELIMNVTKNAVSGTSVCKASQNATQCVNAASCSMNVEADANMLRPIINGTVIRMKTVQCEAPSCTNRYKDVIDCKAAYTTAFTNAGADNNKKCTARNDMVKCLRVPWCNPYLKGFIMTEFKALKTIIIKGCAEILPLEEPKSGAPSSRATLLPALASLLIGYFVVRM